VDLTAIVKVEMFQLLALAKHTGDELKQYPFSTPVSE
jgi:hypothetical protein